MTTEWWGILFYYYFFRRHIVGGRFDGQTGTPLARHPFSKTPLTVCTPCIMTPSQDYRNATTWTGKSRRHGSARQMNANFLSIVGISIPSFRPCSNYYYQCLLWLSIFFGGGVSASMKSYHCSPNEEITIPILPYQNIFWCFFFFTRSLCKYWKYLHYKIPLCTLCTQPAQKKNTNRVFWVGGDERRH